MAMGFVMIDSRAWWEISAAAVLLSLDKISLFSCDANQCSCKCVDYCCGVASWHMSFLEVGTPLSAEMPAPVKKTTVLDLRKASAARCKLLIGHTSAPRRRLPRSKHVKGRSSQPSHSRLIGKPSVERGVPHTAQTALENLDGFQLHHLQLSVVFSREVLMTTPFAHIQTVIKAVHGMTFAGIC